VVEVIVGPIARRFWIHLSIFHGNIQAVEFTFKIAGSAWRLPAANQGQLFAKYRAIGPRPRLFEHIPGPMRRVGRVKFRKRRLAVVLVVGCERCSKLYPVTKDVGLDQQKLSVLSVPRLAGSIPALGVSAKLPRTALLTIAHAEISSPARAIVEKRISISLSVQDYWTTFLFAIAPAGNPRQHHDAFKRKTRPHWGFLR